MVELRAAEGSFEVSGQDEIQETMTYLSLAGLGGPEGVQYNVDRSRSIFELIDESKSTPFLVRHLSLPFIGNKEFENFENLTGPQRL